MRRRKLRVPSELHRLCVKGLLCPKKSDDEFERLSPELACFLSHAPRGCTAASSEVCQSRRACCCFMGDFDNIKGKSAICSPSAFRHDPRMPSLYDQPYSSGAIRTYTTHAWC